MEHSSFSTKTLASLLVVAIVAPTLVFSFPQKTHAQFAVVEANPVMLAAALNTTAQATGTDIKSNILDRLVIIAAKVAIQSITKSIVNWINSGFNGSPAFETNLKNGLLSVADGVAKNFVLQLTVKAKIDSPFLNSVIKGVAGAYYLATNKDAIVERLRYNLKQTVENDRAFLQGNFSEGGFNGWFAASQNPQNNPWGSRVVAEQELNSRIDSEVDRRMTELGWGKGFLSWRKCTSYASGGTTALDSSDTCTNESIQTPGSVIESQLEQSLGTGIRQLELADSFNEIVSALMGQLVNQVLGGTGLRGTSQATTRDTTSYLDQATGDTSTTAPLQESFVATLATLTTQFNAYKESWSKIKTAAEEAKAGLQSCSSGNASALLSETVDPLITEAGEHLAEVDIALQTTGSLQSRAAQATASNTDATAAFLDLSNEYNALVASISPQDIAEAQIQASDSEDPLSLYRHMKNIVSELRNPRTGCATVD